MRKERDKSRAFDAFPMSAPAGTDHGGVLSLLTTEQRDVFIRALSRIAAAACDTAGPGRPLGAGARPTMHEDRTARPRNQGAAFEEDDRRERVTTTDI